MLLLVQVLIILALACTLIAIYADELRNMRLYRPHARIEEIWLGTERRKAVRVPITLEVVYYHDKKGGGVSKTYTENISMGGLKIQTEEKLKNGEPLLLEIKIPNTSKPIAAKGEIVWVKDAPAGLSSGKRVFGAGLKFTHIKFSEKQKLASFIENELVTG